MPKQQEWLKNVGTGCKACKMESNSVIMGIPYFPEQDNIGVHKNRELNIILFPVCSSNVSSSYGETSRWINLNPATKLCEGWNCERAGEANFDQGKSMWKL